MKEVELPTCAEDNFRVEIWDSEERVLLKTLARSPNQFVSQAAFNEATRRFPDFLLLHRNERHTMQRHQPGDPPGPESCRSGPRRTRPLQSGALTPFASPICRNGTSWPPCAPNAAIAACSTAGPWPAASAGTAPS